ncbi:MAG: hypothetical protein H0T89_04630 [Deltaproteobacteria bacterium]|nr:hypothetical protein [Deltaproteobacteria bacterium]MDQ3295416.1 hypothetical protein [Myxococcota bacterium]
MRGAILAVVLLTLARLAEATPYETFIDVDDQADLDDLLAAGDLTQDTYDELLELLSNGIDLGTADRAELYALPNLTYEDVDKIIQYRELQKGLIGDPTGLIAAGALTERKLLAIAAFIVVRPVDDRIKVRGTIQLMTRWAPSDGDDRLPPFASRGRFTMLKHVRAGYAATLTRLRLGDAVFDPNRGELLADRPGTKVQVPKLYVMYEDEKYAAIGGSYRIGFGQRLVFDNSSRYTPNGLTFDDQLTFSADLATECRESGGELPSPCLGAARYRYVTPDWRWREGLFGAGAGLKHVDLAAGWLQAYVWASSARRSIYQYELYDRARCTDVYDDADPGCSAPPVYVRPEGNVLSPTTRHSFQTLPNVFRENLVGANVGYFADRRNSVGLTAYGADSTNLIEGIDLDTQEWSRIPIGRRYGAAGANFSFGRDWLDVFGEAAYTYDKSPDPVGPIEGGGGPGAVLRVTATKQKQELETVVRYYGIDHENPYSRPISQPDELDGSRARDEVGVRVRYVTAQKLYTVRAAIDVWTPLTTMKNAEILGKTRAQPKLETYVRTDVRTSHELWLGLWLRYQDKDLGLGGHDECFEVSTEENEAGETIPCAGRQLSSTARARYQYDRKLRFTAMFEHQMLDDEANDDTKFRHDIGAWLIALYHPQPRVRIRGRMRYLDEAINDNAYLERSLSALVDTVVGLRERDAVRIRVDTKFWLDKRASTKDREPSTELQLWLSYEARL